MALYCTQEKHYRFNVQKHKKNSRYIHSNCSPTSEVHAALKLLSALLSDSLNYLPQKTARMRHTVNTCSYCTCNSRKILDKKALTNVAVKPLALAMGI